MDKWALVTGASSGIGRAVAVRLARDGFGIRVHGRDPAKIEATCGMVRAAGAEAEGRAADFARLDEVEALGRWASEKGDLSVVVNVAGGGASTPVSADSFGTWDEVLNLTLRGPMRLTALTLPCVAEHAGIFVFVAGLYTRFAPAGKSGYVAGRRGIDGFAETLFEDVRDRGVRVTRIHPGFVNTPLIEGDRLDRSKLIQPEDLADLVAAVINLPATACVTEMVVRPQRSPYR